MTGTTDQQSSLEDVEVLTAKGRGAVAVLRISLASELRLQQVINHFFRSQSGVNFSAARIGRILYGRWGNEDLVITRVSSTTCEIHCHGGSAAVEAILADLQRCGLTVRSRCPATLKELQQCIDRAQQSGDNEPLQSLVQEEIMRLLLQAPTRRTARHLLAQLQGVLSDRILQIARIAEPEDRTQVCAEILRWKTFTEHLTVPWRILVFGRPNVGKSSLINALVGFERSIVFDQPGTTRDLIDVRLILDEWPFELVDSAGIRSVADHPIESAGIQRAIDAAANCDACLLLEEFSGWPDITETRELAARIRNAHVALVLTKCDLADTDSGIGSAAMSAAASAAVPPFSGVLHTSATRQTGLDQVREWLVQTLIPDEPAMGTPLPLSGCISEFLQSSAQP